MSKNDIKLSPKHGLNPTIPICFFCGETKNEIALLGRIGDGRKGEDIQAPMKMILDYEPCDKCKEIFAQGVLLVEVTRFPNAQGQPEIQKDAYPTGRHCVVKPEALNGNFKAGDKALVLKEDYERMFGLDR